MWLSYRSVLVERHDRAQVVRGGVLQERGLQQSQAPAAPRLLRLPENGGGGADLQDVDLEPGEDLALDRLRQPELRELRAVGPVRVVSHGRDLRLLALRALPRPGRGEDARGRGQVGAEGRRDSGVVVDRGPRTTKVPGGSVCLVRLPTEVVLGMSLSWRFRCRARSRCQGGSGRSSWRRRTPSTWGPARDGDRRRGRRAGGSVQGHRLRKDPPVRPATGGDLSLPRRPRHT